MKHILFVATICLIGYTLPVSLLAQEEDSPVYPPFETASLIDNQTTFNPYKGSLTFSIKHRFSQIEELSNLFGIFGSANTRLGFTYGVTDKIMLGFGTTRSYMLQDLEWKYALLAQTESGRIPVSISYYGNAVIDARDSKYFGPEEDFKFAYRVSYLNQIIISRKFGDKVGLQLSPTFVYYNAVPEGYSNVNASIDFGGRLQVLGFHSIIFEYDQPLLMPDTEIYPNVALGVEIGTSTHSFRIFASNYNAIVKNRNVAFNGNDPLAGEFQFGFNIAIRF